jgi:hypothetical protein
LFRAPKSRLSDGVNPSAQKIGNDFEDALPAMFGDEIGAQGGGGAAKNKHKIAPFFPAGSSRPDRRAGLEFLAGGSQFHAHGVPLRKTRPARFV